MIHFNFEDFKKYAMKNKKLSKKQIKKINQYDTLLKVNNKKIEKIALILNQKYNNKKGSYIINDIYKFLIK